MRIGFVYRPSNPYLNGMRAQVNMRKFFIDALPQAADVTLYGDDREVDLTRHADEQDAWVFFDAVAWGLPDRIIGVDKLRGPKVCMIGDCHGAEKVCPMYGCTKLEACRRFGFDAYFFQHTESYFRRFFPTDWTYWWVPFGVDEKLYAKVQPFVDRRFDKVLLTGVLGPEYYPLRTALAIDGRVHRHAPGSYSGQNYTPGQYDGDRYKLLLERWRASVSSGYSVLCKYFEVSAAGCLNFAHVDDDNDCGVIGFEHMETAVLIDRSNVLDRLDWFLEDPEHPRWAEIADAGRQFMLENYTHRKMARRLVDYVAGLC